jgi:hypothetical protein
MESGRGDLVRSGRDDVRRWGLADGVGTDKSVCATRNRAPATVGGRYEEARTKNGEKN